ncbi:hypothetical protein TWF730_008062 [Orbilia blumenaviensis]|uniref:Peptidase M10 metallopeptidase domain-containing protein n=1 Tax=Orbilia blumenaviensis TaxID=1796055 RepID=A0AAV9V9P4_9PEZI
MTNRQSHAAIQLDYGDSTPDFVSDSVIRYYVELDAFTTFEQSEYAAECFEAANELWRGAPVRFQRVFYPDTAYFLVVGSSRDQQTTYASAFFSNDLVCLRKVTIYPLAFQHPEAIVSILAYELGHMLGLHELASETEQNEPSLWFGVSSPLSAMQYYRNLGPVEIAIHWLDIELLVSFYDYAYNRGQYQGSPTFLVDIDMEGEF